MKALTTAVVLGALLCACNTVSRVPNIKPTPPQVDCQQSLASIPPEPPAADAWVQYVEPSTMWTSGVARLSEEAAQWVIDVLASARNERALRKVEHDCLDAHEKAGVIRQ